MGKVEESKGGGVGSLSMKYESNGNPGTVANNPGDIGGASYGSYQIATNTGTMKSFLSFVKQVAPKVAAVLTGNPGTAAFNAAWKKVSSSNPKAFENLQHAFIKSSHYEPVVKRLADSGLNLSNRSKALQDVVWSTAVQHGVGGATTVIKNALAGNPGMSDEQLIRRIYAERGAGNGQKYFGSSSDSVRRSVVGRFQNEMKDALNML